MTFFAGVPHFPSFYHSLMPARIIILDADPWLRHAAQREVDRDPEGWLEQRLKAIALVGSRHPDAVFPPPWAKNQLAQPPLFLPDPPPDACTDSGHCLKLVHSMRGRKWRKAQRRLQREWEQQLAEADKRRKAEPPPPPPTGHRFYSSELEGRPDLYIQRRDEMKARLKAERETKR